MTIEWLEEQYSKALDKIDELGAEVEQLRDVIWDLLPVDEAGRCIECEDTRSSFSRETEDDRHLNGGLCLWHPYYDRARKTLGIELEGQE